jgi:shikimate dehydrogenase
MKHCAVIGSPISHSRSPDIFAMFAQQTGIEVSYNKMEVTPESVEGFVKDYFDGHNVGLNVTLPLKELVFDMADVVTPAAKAAKASNTLYVSGGELVADNTDGRGMLQDITHRLGWAIKGKRILIVGAGGAVRGVIQPLLSASPEQVVIYNRTSEKAELLAQEFRLDVATDESLSEPFDLIVNGTSAGLNGNIPDIPTTILSSNSCVYDMVYAADDTPFVRWAKNNGVTQVSDGLGMLVEQAAEAFAIWFGQRPDTDDVFTRLRASL